MDLSQYKAIIEGLLFVSGSDGLTIKQIAAITELNEDTIDYLLNELKYDYENASRGIQILESEKHFYLGSKPEHTDYFRKLRTNAHTSRLTQASLETLAIIAYNQPLTRTEVDEIRGVKSDRPIQTILSRGLIEEVGQKKTIGRPMMFGTTLEFLTYFGLRSIDELPPLNSDIDEVDVDDEASLYYDKLRDD